MMDRALKERIIGAVVLVAVVVLVVPVFLDGPPTDGEVRTERVPLPGQDPQDTQTVVLERNRSEPVPATVKEADPTPAKAAPAGKQTTAKQSGDEPAADASVTSAARQDRPSPAVAEPSPEPVDPAPAEAREPEVRTASATGMFAVQLGSFSNKENAEQLAADLRKQGYAAFLSQLQTDKGQLHRVRIGPQKDRKAAEAMAARLQKAGHEGQVVPHP